MRLYLVQHGVAASKETDPQRPLTNEGINQTQKIAEFIKPLNLSVEYLWHSEKKRAIQTADILSEVVKVNKERIARSDIDPNDDVSPIADELFAKEGDVVIVGHLPFLSKLASLILADSEDINVIEFHKSGIVCLQRTEQKVFKADWIITPQVIS